MPKAGCNVYPLVDDPAGQGTTSESTLPSLPGFSGETLSPLELIINLQTKSTGHGRQGDPVSVRSLYIPANEQSIGLANVADAGIVDVNEDRPLTNIAAIKNTEVMNFDI